MKNRALLKNITDKCPVMYNKIRWNSKYSVLNRFVELHADLKAVANDELSSLKFDQSDEFYFGCKKYAKQLEEINIVATRLQRQGRTWKMARTCLEKLLERLIKAQAIPEHHVFKVQSGKESTLTPEEEHALRFVTVDFVHERQCDNDTNVDDDFNDMNESIDVVLNRYNKKFKMESGDAAKVAYKRGNYVNLDFILGSTAEVERLWSVARHLLGYNRQHMQTEVFEWLMFLKTNKSYWDKYTVIDACRQLGNQI